MIREEAKAKNFDILQFVANNAGLSIFETIEKAYNMGASEQEAVLDKIRAEIEEIYMNITYQENKDRKATWGLRKALEIIDKHRTESEDKE